MRLTKMSVGSARVMRCRTTCYRSQDLAWPSCRADLPFPTKSSCPSLACSGSGLVQPLGSSASCHTRLEHPYTRGRHSGCGDGLNPKTELALEVETSRTTLTNRLVRTTRSDAPQRWAPVSGIHKAASMYSSVHFRSICFLRCSLDDLFTSGFEPWCASMRATCQKLGHISHSKHHRYRGSVLAGHAWAGPPG